MPESNCYDCIRQNKHDMTLEASVTDARGCAPARSPSFAWPRGPRPADRNESSEVTRMPRNAPVGLLAALLLIAGHAAAFPTRADSKRSGSVVRTGLPTYQRIAVLVGLDRYACQDTAVLPHLHGARADVKALGQVLRTRYRFTGLPKTGMPSPPITLLDEQATKANVLRTLTDVAAVARRGDQVLLYFSGCGSCGDTQATLCPYDALAASPANDIWAGDLYKFVSDALARKGANGTVILDCSFGPPRGTHLGMDPATRRKYVARSGPPAGDQEETISESLGGIVADNGVLLTACAPSETAREAERGEGNWMGLFTQFLVDELTEGDYLQGQNWRALVDRIAPRVKQYVTEKLPNDPLTQTPTLYGDSEGAAAVSLFHPAAPKTPERADEADRVRLCTRYYGDDPSLGARLRERLSSWPLLQLVGDQAEITISVFQRPDGIRAYLSNSIGEILREMHYPSAQGDVTGRFLDGVEAEVRQTASGLLAYRWSGKLAERPADGRGPRVTVVATNAKGEKTDQIIVGEAVTVTVTADRPCYFTFYSILPSGGLERLPAAGQAEDCLPLSPGQPWQTTLRPDKLARYRLLVIAKDRREVDSDEVLGSLWEWTTSPHRFQTRPTPGPGCDRGRRLRRGRAGPRRPQNCAAVAHALVSRAARRAAVGTSGRSNRHCGMAAEVGYCRSVIGTSRPAGPQS